MDVIDLKIFYDGDVGRAARCLLTRHIRAQWPGVTGMRIAGLGFATPYLEGWRKEALSVFAVMPARQGVVHWPRGERSATALVDETELPLDDASIDRVLIVHGLEMSADTDLVLGEAGRVLKPDGKVLIVVPNRRGIWARAESTPFGHGTPFSRAQLTRHLQDAGFSPDAWVPALFFPPLRQAILRRSVGAWERLGTLFWPAFSGVIMVQASKQVYSVVRAKHRIRLPRRLKPIIDPVPAARTQS